MMTNKTYDYLRIISQLILPIGTFVSGVMSIWGVPHADQIMATFAALDVLSGTAVTIAKAQWDRRMDG